MLIHVVNCTLYVYADVCMLYFLVKVARRMAEVPCVLLLFFLFDT